jgi:radical SAM superfamily enzyme YgiQ (UPF0313 family)
MRVTFVIPPVLQGKRPAERTAGCTHVVYLAPNIYELTVAAVVEQDPRNQVRYVDCVYDKYSHRRFERFLDGDDSEVYCVWMVNLSLVNDLEAISIMLARRPDCKVLLLGPAPTHFAQMCLIDQRIIVVRGEPEATVRELLQCLNDGTPWQQLQGVSCLNDAGEVVENPPRPLIKQLDELPFPARHFIKDRRYYNPKLPAEGYTTAFTSRNCPYQCIYCVPSSLTFAREMEHRRYFGSKPPVAKRSVESVDAEMASLAESGYKVVGFMDDNFIWDEQRTLQLCQVMRKHNLLWGCQARVDAITETIAEALAHSGCRYVDLGVESFDDSILEYVKKGITSEQIYTAIDILKRHGVPVKLNILIGSCPLETPETVRHTLREAKRLQVDQVMFNIVSPFPGTKYYELCKSNGWLKGGYYTPTDVQRHSIVDLPHLSARQMERALFRNNVSYFLSWQFLRKQWHRFSSWRQFSHALRALRIKLFG